MQIELKKLGTFLALKLLEKTIETMNSREFKSKVIDFVTQEHHYFLILNLSEVNFIDSNGLGTLVSILKLLTNHQGSLVICEAKDSIKRIFTLTRLSQVIPLFANEEEAVKFLQEKVHPPPP